MRGVTTMEKTTDPTQSIRMAIGLRSDKPVMAPPPCCPRSASCRRTRPLWRQRLAVNQGRASLGHDHGLARNGRSTKSDPPRCPVRRGRLRATPFSTTKTTALLPLIDAESSGIAIEGRSSPTSKRTSPVVFTGMVRFGSGMSISTWMVRVSGSALGDRREIALAVTCPVARMRTVAGIPVAGRAIDLGYINRHADCRAIDDGHDRCARSDEGSRIGRAPCRFPRRRVHAGCNRPLPGPWPRAWRVRPRAVPLGSTHGLPLLRFVGDTNPPSSRLLTRADS